MTGRRAAFVFGTDLEEKQCLFDQFANLEKSNDRNAVLHFNAVDAFTVSETVAILIHSSGSAAWKKHWRASITVDQEVDGLHPLAWTAFRYDKRVIFCLRGEAATPFLGLSSKSDVRLAAMSMALKYSKVDIGVPSAGGLGFLLPESVGQGHAAEWPQLSGAIAAISAHRKRIVNGVLDGERLEAEYVAWIQMALTSGTTQGKATCQLIYHDIDALDVYLNGESKVRIQISSVPRRR